MIRALENTQFAKRRFLPDTAIDPGKVEVTFHFKLGPVCQPTNAPKCRTRFTVMYPNTVEVFSHKTGFVCNLEAQVREPE
jgi:hypothetical protein